MVRKTKEEAQATRERILDAAEHLFHAQGVSATSLQDVAAGAGVTRGAVYWHFSDKADLFNAMMDRVCLPMEVPGTLADRHAPAQQTLRAHLLGILRQVAEDEQVGRVFEIATRKIEHVDSLRAIRDRHVQGRGEHMKHLTRVLRAAQSRAEIQQAPSARQMAMGLQALLDGLIHNWMLDRTSFNLMAAGRSAIDIYLAGLQMPAQAAPGAAAGKVRPPSRRGPISGG
jgi:TetR/AcrR family acrAB operon transcriptional repressor